MDETRTSSAQAEARQRLLAWLTLAFRDPQQIPVEDLLGAELEEWAALAGIELRDLPEVTVCSVEQLGSALAPEYVRLFVNSMGGQLAHLEAAAYLQELGPEQQSEFMLELGQTLQSAGYAPGERESRSEDHLSLLLEFLYREGADQPLPQNEFARRFLLPWLPTMLERLASARPHPLYERAGRSLAACFGLPFPSAPGEP